MGIGAAMAFYEENADWLDSAEDAYGVLYPSRVNEAKSKRRCPICGKKCKSDLGVIDHMTAVHTKKKHQQIIDDFIQEGIFENE